MMYVTLKYKISAVCFHPIWDEPISLLDDIMALSTAIATVVTMLILIWPKMCEADGERVLCCVLEKSNFNISRSCMLCVS